MSSTHFTCVLVHLLLTCTDMHMYMYSVHLIILLIAGSQWGTLTSRAFHLTTRSCMYSIGAILLLAMNRKMLVSLTSIAQGPDDVDALKEKHTCRIDSWLPFVIRGHQCSHCLRPHTRHLFMALTMPLVDSDKLCIYSLLIPNC